MELIDIYREPVHFSKTYGVAVSLQQTGWNTPGKRRKVAAQASQGVLLIVFRPEKRCQDLSGGVLRGETEIGQESERFPHLQPERLTVAFNFRRPEPAQLKFRHEIAPHVTYFTGAAKKPVCPVSFEVPGYPCVKAGGCKVGAETDPFCESFSGPTYLARRHLRQKGSHCAMDDASRNDRSNRYIIQVQNHLNSHWEHWFEGMTLRHTDDGQTILSGVVADQSALHGLLEKIRNLNLTLLSVRKVDTD